MRTYDKDGYCVEHDHTRSVEEITTLRAAVARLEREGGYCWTHGVPDEVIKLQAKIAELVVERDEAREAAKTFWLDLSYMDTNHWYQKCPWLEDE